MTTETMLVTAVSPRRETATTNSGLLRAGLVGGPVFVALAVLQALTRPGFDITRHPVSALTLGDAGWIQMASFIGTGILTIIFAIGVRRVIRGQKASTFGPLLLAGFGVGLIIAGAFVPDPAFGFPAGAPAGMPTSISAHAALHGVGLMLAFGSLVLAIAVLARRFASQGRRGLVAYSIASAVVAFALAAGPSGEGASIRYAIAAAIAWAWVVVLAIRLSADQRVEAAA